MRPVLILGASSIFLSTCSFLLCYSYYDIVLGDPDPDVFIPPPQCRE